VDLALDLGDVETAVKLAELWKGSEDRALRVLRLSRLARCQGRLDGGDKYSLTALTNGSVTTRSLAERVYVLAAREKPGEAGPLLAKYPLVLGTMSGWLSGFAAASAGKVDDACGRTASLEPAPSLAPERTVAAMKDRRCGPDYVRDPFASGIVSREVIRGGERFAIDGPGRRPPKQ
jgi:hypothetical protein